MDPEKTQNDDRRGSVRILIENPRTTCGGLVILGALGMLWTHAIDLTAFVVIMGIAGGWIGLTSKDAK